MRIVRYPCGNILLCGHPQYNHEGTTTPIIQWPDSIKPRTTTACALCHAQTVVSRMAIGPQSPTGTPELICASHLQDSRPLVRGLAEYLVARQHHSTVATSSPRHLRNHQVSA